MKSTYKISKNSKIKFVTANQISTLKSYERIK